MFPRIIVWLTAVPASGLWVIPFEYKSVPIWYHKQNANICIRQRGALVTVKREICVFFFLF